MVRAFADVEDTLPNKPSELIRVALRDLEYVEKSPQYLVDMGTWFSSAIPGGRPCAVCLAGSVVVRSLLKESPTRLEEEFIGPLDFAYPISGKLYALDAFRRGCIHEGLARFYGYTEIDLGRIIDLTGIPERLVIEPYHISSQKFHKDLQLTAECLRLCGH